MMILNKVDGEIDIAGFKITPGMSVNDILKLQNKYNIELAIKNAGYISYRITDIDGGETAIILTFYHEKIFDLSIGLGKNIDCPPYQINEMKRSEYKKRLAALGGEFSYSWGDVGYSEDWKNGDGSIIIRYF